MLEIAKLLDGDRYHKLIKFAARLKANASNVQFRKELRSELNAFVKRKAAGNKVLLLGLMHVNQLLQKIIFSQLKSAECQLGQQMQDVADMLLLLQIFEPEAKCRYYFVLEEIAPLLYNTSLSADPDPDGKQEGLVLNMQEIIVLARQIIDEL